MRAEALESDRVSEMNMAALRKKKHKAKRLP